MSTAQAAPLITSVVETGGDNEATDTITAKWTGNTWNATVANEPIAGIAIGAPYTVPAFGHQVPAYVDRNHQWVNATNFALIPSYLAGQEYIMIGNDNRDNAGLILDVTVGEPVQVYLLIDNRLSDGDNLTPPTFSATSMQWVLDQGWTATANGINRFGLTSFPDEVGVDEGADGTINQWSAIYIKSFPAGTFQLFQPDNGGRNMYGVVVAPVPEPNVALLLGAGLIGTFVIFRRRRG